MTISKALWLAMQNGKKFSEIYSTVSDEKIFNKMDISPVDKEKLKTLTTFVDEQLREIILEPFRQLKKLKKEVCIREQKFCRWDHLSNWEIDYFQIYVPLKKNSDVYFYVWLCPLMLMFRLFFLTFYNYVRFYRTKD